MARLPLRAVVGSLGLMLLVVVALGAPLLTPHDPLAMHLEDQLQPPNRTHWLGTCLLYTSPSPRDRTRSRMPSSA